MISQQRGSSPTVKEGSRYVDLGDLMSALLDSRATATLLHYFLKRFANACLASFGAPDEVSRSTTVRGSNSSQRLRAFLFTMRFGIGLLHSKCAPGSK